MRIEHRKTKGFVVRAGREAETARPVLWPERAGRCGLEPVR
jgi:hypothetical protein